MAPNFVMVGITFRNTAGPHKGPAVAMITRGNLSVFSCCSFEGYQDTLWMQLNKQFYRECDVYGTIDFIFGDTTVVFQNCNIYPRLPSIGNGNMIAAQGRDMEEFKTSMSFQNCTIRAADDLASSNRSVETYLGRPWRLYSRVVFMQSFMDGLINPAAWHIWDVQLQVDLLYYAEHNNRGPGSNTKDRVKWPGYHVIGAKEAVNFTVSNFLQGDVWLPQTGVPYIGGLI
ncbi:hypothetical protein NL676_009670 [Syzygium grande]|nr:hypothetical protein NL676_009670 [Syzygium grande]